MARQNYSYEKRQKELAKKKKKEEKKQRKLDAKAGLSEEAISENVAKEALASKAPSDQPSQV
ncbi:MAG: hypothetical protein GXO96_06455 [Nitrospirae bacterium]|nr:hypothetical protein [Candidatus Manganitrophaceae bacterium]